jgi:hypothetical protein
VVDPDQPAHDDERTDRDPIERARCITANATEGDVMVIVARIAVATALCGLVLTADAGAGGFATVQLSSTPTGMSAGETWSLDLTVLQHGRTPLDELEPVLTISDGTHESQFPATPTGGAGVYHVDVVFPTAGSWTWKIWDDFSQYHMYGPVEIGPPAGSSGGEGLPAWLVALAAGVALAVGAAVLAASWRRRTGPTPA